MKVAQKTTRTPFEDALDATGFGAFNIAILVLCSILVLSMIFEAFSVSFLVSASACELKTTSVQQGLAAGLPILGVIATSHLWGYLADTRGRRKIIIMSLLVGFVAGVISAFSVNWIMLCIMKLISCGGVSGTFALSMTLLSECTPRSKRSTFIILSTSMFVLASGFMAVVSIPILRLTFSYHISGLNIEFNSWRLLSLVYSAPSALCILGVYVTYESPKYLLSAGREEEALEVLRRMFAINSGKSAEEYQIKAIVLNEDVSSTNKSVGLWASMKAQSIPLLKPPLLKNTLMMSFLYLGIYMCVNPYFMWLPSVADAFMRSVESGDTGSTFCHMVRSANNNATSNAEPAGCVLNQTAMVMMMVITLIFAVLNIVMSALIALVGRKRLLIMIQFVTAIVGYCINFSTNAVVSAVLFIIYLSPILDMGLLTTFTVDIYPTQLRAMAVCLTLMVGRGSAIIGINVLKYLLVHNCEASFYVFSSITLACGVMAFMLPNETKQKKEEIASS